MFAALHAPSLPATAFLAVAQAFTPRFEALDDIVLLDVSGLAHLFGGPDEIGDELFRAVSRQLCGDHETPREGAARPADARVAIGPTATAAILLALGRPGLSVVTEIEMPAMLAALPLSILGRYERIHLRQPEPARRDADGSGAASPSATQALGSQKSEVKSQKSEKDRNTPGASREAPLQTGAGWRHPRSTHQATHARHALRMTSARAARHARHLADVEATIDLLARWGLTTLGALTQLPRADLAERLGERGTRWQRLASGEDARPLVPWVPEAPFEASIDLEWPIEGLEPLSFVLMRLLEPLADRLARADRGAAIVHMRLRLVDKTTWTRQVQLPAPMRDPKTLRTLLLLDLETHPPAAAVDRVGVLIEPTPGRVLQWTLFDRAQPSPEQVSTLVARLTALMGEGHVGSPALVDSWQPGAFALHAFETGRPVSLPPPAPAALHSVVRRFRFPVPARVRVHEGSPVRVQVDRRGLASGAVQQAAGPWRTSGQWWEGTPASRPLARSPARPAAALRSSVASVSSVPSVARDSSVSSVPSVALASSASSAWDRDEWDVSLTDGTIYRLFVEREIGQWFIEGVID